MIRMPPVGDEGQGSPYTLPDPLIFDDGTPVADAETWRSVRRPQILESLRAHVYGRCPGPPPSVDYLLNDLAPGALSGRAVRKQVTLRFSRGAGTVDAHLLLYLPANGPRPAPAFMGLNFFGNHTIHRDPAIRLAESRVPIPPGSESRDRYASARARGAAASRWPVEEILARGYALGTVYYGDLDPDYDDGFHNGIHGLFHDARWSGRAPDEWGAIGAWAWGLSRLVDYAATDDDLDQRRIAVVGHSRLGKTALWAGAQDERFALVVSNNSGCGGAALSRRRSGETVEAINTSFPHWFCERFRAYNGREDRLPVDQHMLIALIAPRPVYVASATEDAWADPPGEFLSAAHASPVYRLLGLQGLPDGPMPDPDQPRRGTISYHVRSGGHDITAYDWAQYLDCADTRMGP